MNADKVLKAIEEAEDMCYAVIDYCREYEELLPEEYSCTDSRMYSIMDSLNFEYNAVEPDNELDHKWIHECAAGVLREAASTLAKLKALVSANKQEIEYCDFA